MKAAIVKQFKEPLVIEESARPTPAADEVLLQIAACGVCHSDLHLAEGDWPQMMKIVKTPLILGHEVVGQIIEKGAAVTQLEIGERVGVAWIHYACGACELCLEGNENLCPKQQITGATVDGGFAELMKAKASHVIKVPAALTSEEAAPLFCAGVTVYRAIKKARIHSGQRVAIFGIGGLGHLAVQIAQSSGAQVIAIDVNDEKLAFAQALGATHCINATTEKTVQRMASLGGAHLCIVTSAAKAAYDAAFYSLRPGGAIAVVGLPAEPLTFPAIAMVGREAHIYASAVGTRQDVRDVLEMAAQGKLQCQIETRPLEQVNEIFAEMRAGKISGRMVLKL
ncbi:MAG: zinc-dependent alcohol dehydrogenase [Acidobacteria bacterium]|nr:zinc-dependent alcohol dehydrogenase [Acidobacteriota bacterium]